VEKGRAVSPNFARHAATTSSGRQGTVNSRRRVKPRISPFGDRAEKRTLIVGRAGSARARAVNPSPVSTGSLGSRRWLAGCRHSSLGTVKVLAECGIRTISG